MSTTRFLSLLLLSSTLATAGITYTCDPSIDARQAGLCNTLNTTIADLYSKTFTDANAQIFITFGKTGLGSSAQYLNYISWNQYINALTTRANTSGNTLQKAAVAALNTYAAPLYQSGKVEISTAFGRSLGFSGMTGSTAKGDTCSPGTPSCFDAVVTVTNDRTTTLYFRSGAEPSDAYDFFAIAQHETNEVLGLSSCIDTTGAVLVNSCDNGAPAAIDLFRYSAAGKLVAINSLSTTPGAYFSYDGGITNGADGVPYSTLSNGSDYQDFAGTCPGNQHVQDAEGCPGHDANLDNGGAEINSLTALGYNPVPAVVSTLPTITKGGVVSHGTASTTLQAGSWVNIFGTNLATTSRIWKDSEIINGNLPTSLDGVSVNINGKPAYIYYISPTQINLQAPDDTATGSVAITVTNAAGTSNVATATLAAVAPAIFTLDGTYPAAVIPTAAGFDYLGPTAKFSYARPAKKGDVVAFFATGLGPASPAIAAGKVVPVPSKTVSQVTVTIGGIARTIDAYIVGAGTYQFNVTIPPTVGTGDNTFVVRINGVQSQAGTAVTIQ